MKKLLLVDDEKELLSSLKSNLEALGYSVETATDGAMALKVARQSMPDIILLDLMLPVLDGYQVLKLLRADARYRHIPIVVITARAEAQDCALAKECGANGFLVKPLELETLFAQIRALERNFLGT